jgi:hypothetical protein
LKNFFFILSLLIFFKIHSASIIPLSDPNSGYILRMDSQGNALAFWGDRYAYSPFNQTFTTSYKISTFSLGLYNAAFNNTGNLFLIWEEAYGDSSSIKYTYKTSDQILKASEIKTLNIKFSPISNGSVLRYCASKNCFFVLLVFEDSIYLLEFNANALDASPIITTAFTGSANSYSEGWFDIDENGNALIAALSNPAGICTDPSLISYRYKPYGESYSEIKTISPSVGAYFKRFVQVNYNQPTGNAYWMINYKESQIASFKQSIKGVVTNQTLTQISTTRSIFDELNAVIAKKTDDNFIFMFQGEEQNLLYNFFKPSDLLTNNIDPTTGAIAFPLNEASVNYNFSKTTFFKNELGLFFSFFRSFYDNNLEKTTSFVGDAFLPASSTTFTINNPTLGYGESRFAAGSSTNSSYTRVIWGDWEGKFNNKYIFSNAPANSASLLNFFIPSLKVQKGIYK